MQIGFNITVSRWMWHVDSLDIGAGIQLGQCLPIIRIIRIIVHIYMYNYVVLY